MKILRSIRTAGLLGITLALAACGQSGTPAAPGSDEPAGQGTVTVQTNTGAVEVPLEPVRVVALDNTSFHTLVEMGITPVAVPKELLPASLSEWADDPEIADVGTHREPRLEEINAVDPDLIIGGKRFVEYTETLAQIAPVVDLAPSVEEADYIAGLQAQTTALGQIFNQQAIADELNAALAEAADEAAALTSGQSVFLANHNGGKIDNGAGRMAPLIEPLDLVDVFAGGAGGSDSVHNDSGLAPETIAQANPDWMIVMDRDAIAAEGNAAPAQATIDAQDAWASTTFVTRNQIVYLDPEFYVTEGIIAYTDFYRQLTKAFQDAA